MKTTRACWPNENEVANTRPQSYCIPSDWQIGISQSDGKTDRKHSSWQVLFFKYWMLPISALHEPTFIHTTQRTLLSTSPSKRHKSTGSLFFCLLAQQKFRGEVITYTHPSSLIWRGHNMILKLFAIKKNGIHIHIRARSWAVSDGAATCKGVRATPQVGLKQSQ